MTDISKLIPLSQAQPLIGYGRAALYDKLKAGELAAVKIGRKTFLTEDEIARFRAANQRAFISRGKPAATANAA